MTVGCLGPLGSAMRPSRSLLLGLLSRTVVYLIQKGSAGSLRM